MSFSQNQKETESNSKLNQKKRSTRKQIYEKINRLTMWSMWAWEMKRKSWEIARAGQRPISKAKLSVGKIMQVSWPAIDNPSTGYPCISITVFLFGTESGGSDFCFFSLLELEELTSVLVVSILGEEENKCWSDAKKRKLESCLLVWLGLGSFKRELELELWLWLWLWPWLFGCSSSPLGN